MSSAPPIEHDITQLLRDCASGDVRAGDRLLPLIYEDLRAISRRERRRSADLTLDTTGLVHEAYLRLAGRADLDWQNRRCYFAYAARAMRGILCDQARRRVMARRNGDLRELDAADFDVAARESPEELLAVDETLRRIEKLSPRMAQVVELHVFAGLEFDEIARQLEVTERTVYRDWRKARAITANLLAQPP